MSVLGISSGARRRGPAFAVGDLSKAYDVVTATGTLDGTSPGDATCVAYIGFRKEKNVVHVRFTAGTDNALTTSGSNDSDSITFPAGTVPLALRPASSVVIGGVYLMGELGVLTIATTGAMTFGCTAVTGAVAKTLVTPADAAVDLQYILP